MNHLKKFKGFSKKEKERLVKQLNIPLSEFAKRGITHYYLSADLAVTICVFLNLPVQKSSRNEVLKPLFRFLQKPQGTKSKQPFGEVSFMGYIYFLRWIQGALTCVVNIFLIVSTDIITLQKVN